MPETLARKLPEAARKPAPSFALAETGPVCSPAAMHAGARIGPNALIQMAEALRETLGATEAEAVFAEAGLSHYLGHPPSSLVLETEAIRLHQTLRRLLGPRKAELLSRNAGRRTADYLLAHRIPRSAQLLLKLMPRRLASHLLVNAISRHAWTFTGSGRFHGQAGRPVRLSILNSPLSRGIAADGPVCSYYTATFERLFRVLVSPDAYAVETACKATGAEACRFEIRL